MGRKLTTSEFVLKAIAKHGNRYDYSKTVYANAHANVTIICSLHGEFRQSADSHSNNGRGTSY